MSSSCTYKKIVKIIVLLVAIPAVYLAGHLGYNYFSGNVHAVIPNKIYRTAQLDDAQLTKVTKQLHLKTIINLRGKWPDNKWYQVESQFAKKHHLNYYSVQFSAYNLPKVDRLRRLVHLLQTAPKPLAFHCEGGADRTGMAAAISVILFDKNPTITDIKKQASWHYNAISLKTVGYQVMMNYFTWLKQHHYKQSKARFLEWLHSPLKMKPYHGRFWV